MHTTWINADLRRMARLKLSMQKQHIICDASKGMKIGTVLDRIIAVNAVDR